MNRLLFWTNLLMFFSTILACPGNQKNPGVKEEPHSASALDTIKADSLATVMNSIAAQSGGVKSDSLSKEEKYNKGTGEKREAPKHNTPNETKLDSLKKAKGEKKKG